MIKDEHSLEFLEKDYWNDTIDFDSYVVKICYNLRKKPLKDFTIEDLRIMISQNIGLKYLVPLALEQLKQNILAEGDFMKAIY